MLFQDNNLFAHLTVEQNVALGIHPGLRLDDGQRETVTAALERVGLGGFAQRRPDQLSGGERQRTALARSLVRNRPVLLLDEPFAALGPALRREMLDLVNALRRAQGFTVLFVTHQPEDDLHAIGRVAFIAEGRVAATGPARDLLLHPSSAALRAYLDSTLASGAIEVTDEARVLAREVLMPPVAWPLRPIFRLAVLPAVGLLPPAIRDQYGLPWSVGRQRLLSAAAALSRGALPLLPSPVRYWAAARRAQPPHGRVPRAS